MNLIWPQYSMPTQIVVVNVFDLLELLSLGTTSQRPKKQSNCYCYHLNENDILLFCWENSLFYQVHTDHHTT